MNAEKWLAKRHETARPDTLDRMEDFAAAQNAELLARNKALKEALEALRVKICGDMCSKPWCDDCDCCEDERGYLQKIDSALAAAEGEK